MAGTRQSNRRKGRQTQLTFSPLPSSSPAASKAAKEHGQRSYASVRFDSSPVGKRRKLDGKGSSEAASALPTPAQSSQLPLNQKISTIIAISSSDESDVVRPQKRRRQPQQQKLDFSNHIGFKFADAEVEEEIADTMTKTKSSLGQFVPMPNKAYDHGVNSSESDDELMLSNHPTRTPEASKSSSRKRTRGSSRREPASSPLTHTRSGRKTFSIVELSSQDDSEEEKVTRRASIMNDPLNIAESETSGDDVPALRSSPTRKSRRKVATPTFVVLSSEEEDNADSEVSVESPKPRKKGRHTHQHDSEKDEEDEEEEEVESATRKSRLSRKSRKITDSEQEDLAEDLEFLQSSPPPRASKKKREPSAREKALEALKQRRASQADPGSSRANAYEIEDEEEEASEDESVYRAENRRDMFLPEEEDEDFIVEAGSEDEIGAPEDIEMPIEFSHLSRAKAKDLFKYVVEWMVQKKINPAFDIENEVYRLAFQKLNDELQGLAGSKFTSSIWTKEFSTSLKARPGIVLIEISAALGCEACNRQSHFAKWDIQFTGKPYHPDTLDDIDQNPDDDDDDSEDDDDDTEERDYRGQPVPSQDVSYKCGSTCKDNATTAHALQHWKYYLNQHIVDYLSDKGHLTPDKIVRRDSHSTKKRRKEANKIVDEMEHSGKIRSIYDDFRKEVNIAREARSGWRGRDYPS